MLKVAGALIEAGADPNSRVVNGATTLYVAAEQGHTDTVKLPLRAKANPLLTGTIFGTNWRSLWTSGAIRALVVHGEGFWPWTRELDFFFPVF